MISLIAFVVLGLWITAAVMLSKRIPRWLGVTKYRTGLSVLIFPLVLIVPIADDLIGRWQFYRLCDREAVVTLSPDVGKVKRARDNNDPTSEIDGYLIPIRVQRVEYVDLDTERPFLSFKAFHTSGGFLQRNFYGLGGSTSCWPPNWVEEMNSLNVDQLVKQGKSK